MDKVKFIFIFTLLNFAGNAFCQQHFPGGVPGAEAWYIAREGDNESLNHTNHGTPHININTCKEKIGKPYLFNFNPSFLAVQLCLMYKAPLENTNSRNVFFVGEPKSPQNMSHLTTGWNADLNPMPTSKVRNWFHLSNDEALAEQQQATYQQATNDNIDFHSWNLYQTDRRFKSFGLDGETNFYIGREFENDTVDAKSFSGNFPEFISFPFELTANQRNRVDSYLGLKYGITLDKGQSYRNSKNIVFWKTVNNKLFGNRIFGIGRDDISGLNQLMGESAHQKNFLVTSASELADNNTIKQEKYRIDDQNFIVYGDNGRKPRIDEYYVGKIQKIERVWLSQNTGHSASGYDMYFKLNLAGDMQNKLISDPHLKVWMMRDKFVNNIQQSGFQGQGIDYYPAYETGSSSEYALFKDIFFDTDNNSHDQFTFGLGPEMILQLELTARGCNPKYINGKVIISGGTAPYDLTITNSNGYYENLVIQENFYAFVPVPNVSYTIYATDYNGNVVQDDFTTDLPQITVDLGPDQMLSSTLPEITLDASAGVLDPGATYSWFMDGNELGIYGPLLAVSEPGYYHVVITSTNGICQMSDGITVSYEFSGTIEAITECGDTNGTATVHLTGGIAPFTTLVLGPNQNLSLVHNNQNVTIAQLEFGQHTVTVTDANGIVFQEYLTIEDPLSSSSIDLIGQLDLYCQSYEQPGYSYPWIDCNGATSLPVDASIPNSNVTYEWFRNGLSLGIYTPQVDIGYTSNADGDLNEIVVVATDQKSGCTTSDGLIIKGKYAVYPIASQAKQNDFLPKDIADNKKPFIEAMVYPNPSERDAQFNYKVTAGEIFNGTVEIYTPLGIMLRKMQVTGQSSYTLTFDLQTSGVYFICTRTNGTILTDKIIIK